MAPGSTAGHSASNSQMPTEEQNKCHERSEMVTGCSPWLPVDDQCGYNMTIVTPNGIFVHKTLIPEENLDATAQVKQKQNGMPPLSSSGYATGATPSSAGCQATSQLPSSDTPLSDTTSSNLSSESTVMDVIHGKMSSSRSDPDSIQVNPPAILSSEDVAAALTEETDSPQQPRNQHHPPPTGEPPTYKFPKEETGVSTTTTDTADNITVAVTHKEDTPPFDGLAPKAFNHNDEDDPLRCSSSVLSVVDGWQTQSTSSQLPMSFTALSSPPPTPTSHKCRFFDDEVSGDSGFGSMPSTDMNLL